MEDTASPDCGSRSSRINMLSELKFHYWRGIYLLLAGWERRSSCHELAKKGSTEIVQPTRTMTMWKDRDHDLIDKVRSVAGRLLSHASSNLACDGCGIASWVTRILFGMVNSKTVNLPGGSDGSATMPSSWGGLRSLRQVTWKKKGRIMIQWFDGSDGDSQGRQNLS